MKRNAKTGLLIPLGLVCLAWVGALGILHPFADALSEHRSVDIASHRNGARFVYADLDGDQKPDLALVELQSRRSTETNYSIHVKLSAGPESAIGVNAPLGGLQVAAQDVNGDDNIDLIVTSNLDGHFIEVLLNDGRGNFSAAAPGDFPQLENESEVVLKGPVGPQADRATLASVRTSFEAAIVECRALDKTCSSDDFPVLAVEPILRRPALSGLGRSPPPPVVL
jgi:hypothetical protein